MRIGLMMVIRNEKDRIKRCLDHHLQWFDEAAICDQSSDDGTWEILQEYQKNTPVKMHLWQDKAHGNCEPSSNPTRDLLTTDWACWVDADEIFPVDFLGKMDLIASNPDYQGYWLKRENSFIVKVYDEHVPVQPKTAIAVHEKVEFQFRFFDRTLINFPPHLHHRGRLKAGREGKLNKYTIIHRKTLEEQLLDNARYKR